MGALETLSGESSLCSQNSFITLITKSHIKWQELLSVVSICGHGDPRQGKMGYLTYKNLVMNDDAVAHVYFANLNN